jgi:hypothetical protein
MVVLAAATQVNVIPPAPPVALTVAEPVQAPGHVILATVGVMAMDAG